MHCNCTSWDQLVKEDLCWEGPGGLGRQLSGLWAHFPVLWGFGCLSWLHLRPASWAELLRRKNCRKSQQGFSPPALGSCFQPRLSSSALAWARWPQPPCSPACAYPSPADPDLTDNLAKSWVTSQPDLWPTFSPWTCLATTRLCLMLSTVSKPALLRSCGTDSD